MIVDACAFLGLWPYSGYGIDNARALVAQLDAHGIDKAAVCSTAAIFGEVERGNQAVRAACREFPARLLPVLTAYPRPDAPPPDFRDLVSAGCAGIRLWPQHHAYRLAGPETRALLEGAVRSGLPVFLSVRAVMNWGLPALSVEDVAAAAAAHPALNIVLGGVNYGEFPALTGLLKAAPNVSVEISCLQMRDPLETLVEVAPPSRILFGSGLPLQYAACSLVKVRDTHLPKDVLDAVCYRNAARLLRIR